MTYGEISAVFMPADTASILQPTEQGVVLTLKSYYLRDTLHKAVDAVEVIPLLDLLKSRIFWEGFIIADAIKKMFPWFDIKTNRSLEEVGSSPHGGR